MSYCRNPCARETGDTSNDFIITVCKMLLPTNPTYRLNSLSIFNKNDSHTVLHVHCISNARNGRLHPDHLMSVLEAVMRACKSWKTCPNPFISYIFMRPEVELVLK